MVTFSPVVVTTPAVVEVDDESVDVSVEGSVESSVVDVLVPSTSSVTVVVDGSLVVDGRFSAPMTAPPLSPPAPTQAMTTMTTMASSAAAMYPRWVRRTRFFLRSTLVLVRLCCDNSVRRAPMSSRLPSYEIAVFVQKDLGVELEEDGVGAKKTLDHRWAGKHLEVVLLHGLEVLGAYLGDVLHIGKGERPADAGLTKGVADVWH